MNDLHPKRRIALFQPCEIRRVIHNNECSLLSRTVLCVKNPILAQPLGWAYDFSNWLP